MASRFLRPLSRGVHILIADGIQGFDETFMRVKGVNKLLLYLRGSPEISQTNGGNKSTIYDGTIQSLALCMKYKFC